MYIKTVCIYASTMKADEVFYAVNLPIEWIWMHE